MTTKQQVVGLLASAVTVARGRIWRREAAVRIRGGTALLVLAVLVSLAGAAQPEPTAIPVKGDAPTFLYGGGAASRDNCVRQQAGDSFRWTGSGQITWKVQVDRAGDYEVALGHAAEPGAVGQELQVSSGSSRVRYTLAMTKGVFGNKSYEMTPIKGPLRLEAGAQTIALSIPNAPKAMAVLDFRSLGLIPVAAKAAIEAERQEAQRARASTEWIVKAGYGLMFHWTSQSIGKDGTHKPYAQAVDDFEVKPFADMVEETGAGYVFLTIGHAESYCPGPITAWEKYHPGKTTRRDLIAEMADALNARGIKMMCYLNVASLARYPRSGEDEFTRIMTEIVTEFGQHYKEKVAGYWFDCCYQAREKYPGFSFREFFKTCKAGNPNRILTLNSWIYPNVSEWQEYWAGEVGSPVGLPVNGTTPENGPGAGLRYHALLLMEPYWVQQRVDMPRPQFTAQRLGDYVSQCKANGGAVTINLGMYQDGTVDPSAVNVLKEVRKRVTAVNRGGPKPAPSEKPAPQKDPPRQGRALDGVELLRDVEIGTGGGRALHADIARPKTPPAGLMPAVLWIHGGGWTSGSHHDLQQTVQLANHGYLVLSVEYRFVNEAIWPAQIQDCKLAVRWLRANAAKYQVNPDRIGCWGASAGGHLAALMGVTRDKPDLEGNGGSAGFSSRVQAVVDFCGPTDFKGRSDVTRKMAGGTYEEKPGVFKQMSPLENVNPKACPFLIVNGEKDTTVPLFHAQLMTEALKQANVPVELIIVKNAGHGYTFVAPPGGPPAQPSPAEVDAAVLNFLDANLKK